MQSLSHPRARAHHRHPGIYVASSYANAPAVRDVHATLHAYGFDTTSSWAEHANGAEALHLLSPDQRIEIVLQNDADIARSFALLALASRGHGGEMFCEVARALILHRLPVVWLGWGGYEIASCARPGVFRVEDLHEALTTLLSLARWQRRYR